MLEYLLVMSEIFKPVPEKEKGALGPIDDLNRLSYRVTKPAAIISGIGAFIGVPYAALALIITAPLAVLDKGQLEVSKWLRRKVKGGEMKAGQEVTLSGT